MTDYYPLLARAVAGLDPNTGEARRALYERARNALVTQLRGSDPPLSESEITRERLALEEAVRKVEADAARQMRAPPPPRPEPPPPPPPPPPEPPPAPRRATPTPPPPERQPEARRPERQPEARPPASEAPPPHPPVRPRPRADRATEPGEGHGLRDVVADADTLGKAAAQASRSAREAYSAVPSETPELDRLEPRLEPEGRRAQQPPARPAAREPKPPEPHTPPAAEAPAPAPAEPLPRRPPGPMPRRPVDLDEDDGDGKAARRGLIAALLAVAVIAGLGASAYWQRERISGWFGAVRIAPPVAHDDAQPRTKSADRVGQPGQPAQTPAGSSQTAPVVAQRVVLYEEDPANPEGNRYVGSVLWRTETITPGPGLSPELAIRADVDVPERRLQMTMSIRRNTDTALPASHTIEIMFTLPADFVMGGVANVPGILMKEAEQARGAPISGLAVKVTSGFFLIGLSAVEADKQRNLQLLRERSWFDIPMVYNNGRRAILAVEKGTPGERVFAEAFAAWSRQ